MPKSTRQLRIPVNVTSEDSIIPEKCAMRFERRTGSFTASWSGFVAKRETEIELQTGGSARSGDVNYTAC
jgi:hypothetical protein